MSSQARQRSATDVYHVIQRGIDRMAIYYDDENNPRQYFWKGFPGPLEIGNNTVHDFRFVFSSAAQEIKFFVFHFYIRTTATVYPNSHLSTHGIRIHRRSHNDNIGNQNFTDDSRGIILLRTRFLILATYAASQTTVDYLITDLVSPWFFPSSDSECKICKWGIHICNSGNGKTKLIP